MKNFNAIRFLYPNSEFSMVNDDVNLITWVGQEYPIPTEQELADAITAMETAEAEKLAAHKALKESAKAKLVSGERLTPEEAATIVI